MPTFSLAQKHADLDQHNAELMIQVARETGDTPITPTKASHPVVLSHLGCERQLRGIPVVGARGVGGAINGTRPGPR